MERSRIIATYLLTALLMLLAAPSVLAQYGTGNTLDVPSVEASAITIDGNADEEAWADASVISIENGDFAWDGGWNDGYGAEPDIGYTTRLLHAEGKLFVHILVEDYQEFFWSGFGGESAIVGVDLLHQAGVTDAMVDDGWSGFSMNSLEDGPLTFYANGTQGVTINWGGGDDPVDPEEAGYIDAEVVVDEENLTWSVEMAILSDQITSGRQIGFNVGGSAAHPDEAYEYEEGARDYAWFSWQTCNSEAVPEGTWCGAGGTILQNSYNYGTLTLGAGAGETAIEETPGEEKVRGFALGQNYPNPFRGGTHLSYTLAEPGHVRLGVYDVLGRQVATLVDGARGASHYDVQWQTEGLPGGLYFYRLEVDGRVVATRTMTVLK